MIYLGLIQYRNKGIKKTLFFPFCIDQKLDWNNSLLVIKPNPQYLLFLLTTILKQGEFQKKAGKLTSEESCTYLHNNNYYYIMLIT